MIQTAAPAHEDLEPVSDQTLVAGACERPDDFGLLYKRYLPRVYRYLLARVGVREEAADLTQLVFMRAFDALPKYRPGKAPFAAWLFRIARNAAADSMRRHHRRPTASLDGIADALTTTADGPEAIAEKNERLERLRGHVGRLDNGKRELLALRFAAGFSVREIAPIVGKSESAVKKQFTRTINELKEHYHDELQ